MIYSSAYQSPFGELTLFKSDRGLCGVAFNHDNLRQPTLKTVNTVKNPQAWPKGPIQPDDLVFDDEKRQLDSYFQKKSRSFSFAIDYGSSATNFQRTVWNALQQIPYGSTTSYGELAKQIGNSRAARAVGLANNRNPLAIIVPCHRVVGADGSLVGYAGGLQFKRALLELEGVTVREPVNAKSKKDHLLTVAAQEFATYGFVAARIDRISKHSGLNKRVIYSHFPSKQRLYNAVFQRLNSVGLNKNQVARLMFFRLLEASDDKQVEPRLAVRQLMHEYEQQLVRGKIPSDSDTDALALSRYLVEMFGELLMDREDLTYLYKLRDELEARGQSPETPVSTNSLAVLEASEKGFIQNT